MNRSRLVWSIRQLLPLHYRTTYSEQGRRHYAVWRMWFGRVFDYDDYVVLEGGRQ